MPSELQNFIDTKLTKVGQAAIEATKEVVDELSLACYEEIKDNTPISEGNLQSSLVITQKSSDRNRYGYTIDYDGYNEKGVAYSLIGRTLNRGTSTIPARRHIDRAVRKLKGMDEKINQRFIEKIDK